MTEELIARALVTLADCGAKSVVILCGAWLVTRTLSRGAAVRHLVWQVAFIILLLLPLLSCFVPSYGVAHVVAVTPTARPTSETAAQKGSAPSGTRPGQTAASVVPHGQRSVAPTSPVRAVGTYLTAGAFILWSGGAALAFLRLAFAYFMILRLRRHSSPGARDGVDLARLAESVGLRGEWELRTSGCTSPPTALTWGLFRPIVLLPQSSARWSRHWLEAVLLHELAHVRRRDCVTQLLVEAACAVYWFNPFVWLCARAVRAEAERAADDLVLRSGVRPSDYAAGLLGLAALGAGRRPSPAGYVLSILDGSSIEARIRAIVEPGHRRRGAKLVEGVAAVAAGLLTLLLFVPYRSVGLAYGAVGAAAFVQDVPRGAGLSEKPDGHSNDAGTQPARPAPAAKQSVTRQDRQAPPARSLNSPADILKDVSAQESTDRTAAPGTSSDLAAEAEADAWEAGAPDLNLVPETNRGDDIMARAAGRADADSRQRSADERRGADILTAVSTFSTEEEQRLRRWSNADMLRQGSVPPPAAKHGTDTRSRPADVVSRSP
jgi:beta-lactamase regulating signal transducer with metallopeptidase domain